MSVASNRSIQIDFTGAVEYSQVFNAAVSAVGSGQNHPTHSFWSA